MNAPVIRHEQRQHQTLTPRLQQAVRLLQLSSLDFAQEVNQAMGNNPFLEPDETGEAEVGGDAARWSRPCAARRSAAGSSSCGNGGRGARRAGMGRRGLVAIRGDAS